MATKKTRRTKPKDPLGIQSVEIGARILEQIAAAPGPMMLRDLSKASGMTASKARRYLVSLLKAGLASQDPATARYDLGEVALRIGLAALTRRNAIRIATDTALDLHQSLDETIALSIWGEKGPTVVSWNESSRPVMINFRLGSILPLLGTASGRVFLAYLPRATTQALLKRELSDEGRRGAGGIDTAEKVDAMIQDIREKRICITRGDIFATLSALAAPVFDCDRKLFAVMTIVSLHGRMDEAALQERSRTLLAAADAVSKKLGYAQPRTNDHL
jgi:DNA-binding IclR family transcriptional regulator